MPTQTKENYLKAIYFLSQKNDEVAISELSKEMQVSNPTTNNMVKKLKENGWVSYQKYKPLRLTSKGQKVAALIIRKHRLTEMFLSRIMGFGWEEVHDIAEEMEHLQSEELFNRMDELLGYPTMDPHGSPIPDKKGNIAHKSYSPLADVHVGSKVRICSIKDTSTELLMYLNRKQIKLGTEIEVLKKEPFDKSMMVSYDRFSDVMLSQEVCIRLLVEKV